MKINKNIKSIKAVKSVTGKVNTRAALVAKAIAATKATAAPKLTEGKTAPKGKAIVLSASAQALLAAARARQTVAHSEKFTVSEAKAVKTTADNKLIAIGDTGCMLVWLTNDETKRVKLNGWQNIGKGTPFEKTHRSEEAFRREQSGQRTGCFFTDSGSIISVVPKSEESIGTGKFWLGTVGAAQKQGLIKTAKVTGLHDGKPFNHSVFVRKSFDNAVSWNSYKSGQWRFACDDKGIAGGRIETYAIGDGRNIQLVRSIDNVICK